MVYSCTRNEFWSLEVQKVMQWMLISGSDWIHECLGHRASYCWWMKLPNSQPGDANEIPPTAWKPSGNCPSIFMGSWVLTIIQSEKFKSGRLLVFILENEDGDSHQFEAKWDLFCLTDTDILRSAKGKKMKVQNLLIFRFEIPGWFFFQWPEAHLAEPWLHDNSPTWVSWTSGWFIPWHHAINLTHKSFTNLNVYPFKNPLRHPLPTPIFIPQKLNMEAEDKDLRIPVEGEQFQRGTCLKF